LKRKNKEEKNHDLPFRRTSRMNKTNDENRIPEASLRRKAFQGTSTACDPKFMGDLNYTASSRPNENNQSEYKKIMLNTQTETGTQQVPKVIEDRKLRKIKQDRNKNDVSLRDLLNVKEYSFVLESPLSTHQSQDESGINFQQFKHVEKDDILKADSLPLTMKEGELSKLLPEKRREKEINPADLINNLNNLNNNNTKRKERMTTINEKQSRRNPAGEIKIIEEFKNSLNQTQEDNKKHQEESYDDSERSSPYISSQKRRLLHQDDTQLEWETNLNSKGNTSRRTKTNPASEHPTLVSTTSILKDRTSREVPSPGLLRESEGIGIPLPQSIKDVRSSTSTINSIEGRKAGTGNRTELVKGNPIRRLANKSGLRNSHLTGSSHTRISTKANTGFNEGEIDSTHNVPLTMYTSLSHSEPLLRLHHDKYSFSHLVETEAGGEEKLCLNSSFPPYWQNEDKRKKENIVTKFPIKRHGNSTAWGSKNIPSFGSLKGTKGLKSNTNVFGNGSGKHRSVTPEGERTYTTAVGGQKGQKRAY